MTSPRRHTLLVADERHSEWFALGEIMRAIDKGNVVLLGRRIFGVEIDMRGRRERALFRQPGYEPYEHRGYPVYLWRENEE